MKARINSSFLKKYKMQNLSTYIINEQAPATAAGVELSPDELSEIIIKASKASRNLMKIKWSKNSSEISPKHSNFIDTLSSTNNDYGRLRMYVNSGRKGKRTVSIANEFMSDRTPSSSHILVTGTSDDVIANAAELAKIIDAIYSTFVELNVSINDMQKKYRTSAEKFVSQLDKSRPGKYDILYKRI